MHPNRRVALKVNRRVALKVNRRDALKLEGVTVLGGATLAAARVPQLGRP